MNYKKCPCVDCVCVAICRLKRYTILIRDCKLVVDYINSHAWDGAIHLPYFRALICDAIDPTSWKVDDHGLFIDILDSL